METEASAPTPPPLTHRSEATSTPEIFGLAWSELVEKDRRVNVVQLHNDLRLIEVVLGLDGDAKRVIQMLLSVKSGPRLSAPVQEVLLALLNLLHDNDRCDVPGIIHAMIEGVSRQLHQLTVRIDSGVPVPGSQRVALERAIAQSVALNLVGQGPATGPAIEFHYVSRTTAEPSILHKTLQELEIDEFITILQRHLQ